MTQACYGDVEIRAALHRKMFDRYKPRHDVLVIDELGLAHAKSRIDIAVINGCIHGYEIKSQKDTLTRFGVQLDTYRRTLSKLTFVCATKHITRVAAEAPEWCGIIEVRPGLRGGIHFSTLRRASRNPELEPEMLAHLLWRDEAASILAGEGVAPRELRKPRRKLYEMIADRMTPKALTHSIKAVMVQRSTWRDRPARPSYDG
jgi:hypothetical protein